MGLTPLLATRDCKLISVLEDKGQALGSNSRHLNPPLVTLQTTTGCVVTDSNSHWDGGYSHCKSPRYGVKRKLNAVPRVLASIKANPTMATGMVESIVMQTEEESSFTCTRPS